MSNRVLVTGASGGIGDRLIPALRERGWAVRALVHETPVRDADEIANGDLGDEGSLARAVEGVDAIVHLAAKTHARRDRAYREVNVAGTRRLLAAGRSAGVTRFVHASTRAISPGGGAYSVSKRDAEQAVADSGLEHTIVRLPEVYGAGGRKGVDDIVARARRGARIAIVGDGSDRLCPVHVDDAISALVEALESETAGGKTYTLAGPCLSMREFAEACIEAFGSNSKIVGIPVALVAAGAALGRLAPLPMYPDQLARLRSTKPPLSEAAGPELGFRPRPLLDGLRQVAS
jgi:nucleoside-diphosphate-sugar epimerase